MGCFPCFSSGPEDDELGYYGAKGGGTGNGVAAVASSSAAAAAGAGGAEAAVATAPPRAERFPAGACCVHASPSRIGFCLVCLVGSGNRIRARGLMMLG
jgi:serine/threonine-protein kinase PBS1